jgi:tellurium resistance protein TerZ
MAINLTKGQRIDLTKKSDNGVSGGALTKFCIGVNWGAIEKTVTQEVTEGGFFGFGGTKKRIQKIEKEAVDLDASCVLLNTNNDIIDIVYYGQLKSKDTSIIHSGDDLEGDMDGDDGLDNEVISVDLTKIDARVDKIVFFLNSYKKQDFADVPFASIRLYEGTPEKVDRVFAGYDIATDSTFKGFISMIMGKLYKRNGEWKFNAIGEPTRDKDLNETLITITKKFV